MGLGAWPWSGPGILSLLEGLFKPLSLCSPHMPSLSNLPPTLQTGLRLRREETGGTWELGDSHAKLAMRSIRSEREGCRDGLEPGEEGGRPPVQLSGPVRPALPKPGCTHGSGRCPGPLAITSFLPAAPVSVPYLVAPPDSPQLIHEQSGSLDYLTPPDLNCVSACILLDQLLTHYLHKAAVYIPSFVRKKKETNRVVIWGFKAESATVHQPSWEPQ